MPGGQEPTDFALADLDNDGDIDMVVANHNTDYLTILLGNGRGSFRPAPHSPLPIAVEPHPHAVRLADLDADGLLDLVVDHRDAESLLILKGLGDGLFELPGQLVNVGGDPYLGLAIGDLNGDDLLDLVTPNPGEVGILLNAGLDTIAFNPAAPVAAAAPFAVGLGDFNGDDLLDLIAASDEGSPLIELYLGNGRGEFTAAGHSSFELAPGGKNIAVGDFNGDEIDNAVVISYHSPEAFVLIGGATAMAHGTLPGLGHPWGMARGDFNLDGRDDLVIADDGFPQATNFLSLEP